MAALPPGTRLKEGIYVLEEVLGRGGFGIAYRARDTRVDTSVAIKECFPAGCERCGETVESGDFFSAAHLESFKRGLIQQAQLLQQLYHPAIVRMLEVFEANNTVYLVMEFADGPTLQQLSEQSGAMPLEIALKWLEPLCGAVRALHDASLLHLDIKPENAIVIGNESEGRLVLVDFDLMQPRESNDFRTRPLALAARCGTPGYAPLEQYAQLAQLTPASDIYALGATFYQLLTGHAPISAVDRAAGEDLASPLIQNPELPTHVLSGLLAALNVRPEERPANVTAFQKALSAPRAEEDEDDIFLVPVTPQFVAHTSGLIHRIVLTTDQPVLPKRCVCCFDRADSSYFLSSPSHKWNLPLCSACEKHQRAAKQAGFVTMWGIAISLAIAMGGVALSVATETFWPVLVGPTGILINFLSMNYGGLKNSRAEELMKDECTDLSQPVTFNFNGRVHIWRFKNARYAEEFKRRNVGFVV